VLRFAAWTAALLTIEREVDTMRGFVLALGTVAAVLLFATALPAQLNPPNQMGVTVGHMHLNVHDVEAAKKFFLDLGGTAIKSGPFEGVKYPGAIFVFTKADPSAGMEDSTVNHIGFLVKDGVALVAKMKAQGAKVVSNGTDPQGRAYGGYIYSPDGVKVEIIQRTTLDVPIRFDQIHFFVADPGPKGGTAWSELQQWYAKEFGVKIDRAELTGPAPGNLASAPMAQSILSGVNFRFSKQDSKAEPTKGRALDHIGFEIKNLAAFCKKLEADGIKMDTPYSVREGGLGLAFITDPMGTRIELNEGLDKR
jgi:catechol 2,3-dioxygenase-like lactoylglutathione lyase family enzyme